MDCRSVSIVDREGKKKPKNLRDVFYGWSLRSRLATIRKLSKTVASEKPKSPLPDRAETSGLRQTREGRGRKVEADVAGK